MTRILEVAENGSLTLPPDILSDARPRMRYIVETNGAQLTLRPEEHKAAGTKAHKRKILTPEEWEKEWKAFSEELSAVWPEGVSVTDVISEMRR